MAQGRGPVIGWSTAVATLASAFAGFVWTNSHRPLHNPLFYVLATIAVAAFLILIVAGIPDLWSWLSTEWLPRIPPPRIDVSSWEYTTDGGRPELSALVDPMHVELPGTGYMDAEPKDRPPWVRVAVMVACTAISPEVEMGEAARDGFEGWLRQDAVMSVVRSLTYVGEDVKWVRSGLDFDWVLGSAGDADGVASARLMLPWGLKPDWHQHRYAVLILHVVPRDENGAVAAAADGEAWATRVYFALDLLPAGLVLFLRVQLGARVTGWPRACVAVRLVAQDLTELVDAAEFSALPGGNTVAEPWGYFISDTPGARNSWLAARRMVIHMLRYALGRNVAESRVPWMR